MCVQLLAGDVERGEQALDEALGEGGCLGGVGVAVEQDRELIPAEAGGGVGGAHGGGEAFGDGDEQVVAGVVAQAVVDDLEVVEVQDEHRQ